MTLLVSNWIFEENIRTDWSILTLKSKVMSRRQEVLPGNSKHRLDELSRKLSKAINYFQSFLLTQTTVFLMLLKGRLDDWITVVEKKAILSSTTFIWKGDADDDLLRWNIASQAGCKWKHTWSEKYSCMLMSNTEQVILSVKGIQPLWWDVWCGFNFFALPDWNPTFWGLLIDCGIDITNQNHYEQCDNDDH